MRSISRYSRAFYSFVRSCSYLSSSCVKRASKGRRRCLLPAARFESRSFPLFLSLAPCKQSKDTGPFSLLLQIHSVSSTPHPFSFQLFPLFSRHSQLRSFFFFRCLDEPPAYSGICISSRVSVVLPAFLSPPQTLLFHHHLTVCICIRVRIPPSLSRAFLA